MFIVVLAKLAQRHLNGNHLEWVKAEFAKKRRIIGKNFKTFSENKMPSADSLNTIFFLLLNDCFPLISANSAVCALNNSSEKKFVKKITMLMFIVQGA